MTLKQSYLVGGLPVNIFTKAPPTSSDKPVFILFLLHGRLETAEACNHIVEGLFRDYPTGLERDLVVVTFDQRNHGHRLVDVRANAGWNKSNYNELHALDIYSIQTGTSQDVSFLIDFLPAYLYPASERRIAEWGVAGVSLGGHSTWISLAHEPRLTVGIPIIGCPDYFTLITDRARRQAVPLNDSKFFPDTLWKLIKTRDPAATEYRVTDPTKNPFIGKKILVMSGGKDRLVPWTASKGFVDALVVGEAGTKRVFVQGDAGHECTPAMVVEMAKFLYEQLKVSNKRNTPLYE